MNDLLTENIYCTYTVYTSDGSVGDSGKAIVLYGLNMPGNTGVANFYNGTSTSGTKVVSHKGTASGSGGTIFVFSKGIVFPNGCYLERTGASIVVSCYYKQIS